jgi:hypothetical protein
VTEVVIGSVADVGKMKKEVTRPSPEKTEFGEVEHQPDLQEKGYGLGHSEELKVFQNFFLRH